jgi:anti-sigma regulatory factor (Ser/Thr protein kinase)
MCWDAAASFPADTRSPGAARRFCTDQVSALLVDGPERGLLLDDLRLIVSELVTNTLNAGGTSALVTLSWHRHQLRVAVADDAPGVPILRAPAGDDTHGRGLAITQSLSSGWGFYTTRLPASPVKQVWAELSVAPSLTEALNCSR